MNRNRFARQILMFGEKGQNKIEAQRVAVVGAGGLGSQLCQALAYTGIRSIGVIDDDRLDETNMNRVAGALPSDVGRRKVEVAKEHILKINPEAEVIAIPRNLRTREALEFLLKCTHICGAVDHDGPRLVLTELAAAYGIPLIDATTEIFPEAEGRPFDFGGRVVVATPGDYCLFCADQLDRELAKEELETPEVRADRRKHGYGLGSDLPAPSVFALNGILANAAVMEFIVMTTGIREAARHLTYKGMRGVMVSRDSKRNPDCYTCATCGQRDNVNIWRYLLPEGVENFAA
ncbi:MAG: ThiF family adenylyltransferase [Verrucomicrobia subdivision 3 bacterium]|nr:ThiF family adenylyltransferase [Limisphaerales bacterium]